MTASERLRSWLRIALAATSACMSMGLILTFVVSGPVGEVAVALIWTGLGLLISIPVLNVVAVLVEEWPTRPRTFAYAALIVLALLAWTMIDRLR